MSTTVEKLPKFTRPPVAEVVLDLHFKRLGRMMPAHAGAFWERIRASYPQLEEHPPLDPPEPWAERSRQPGQLHFRVHEAVFWRQWFVSADGARVVQLQADRLVHNWRRNPSGTDYPSYEHVREGFLEAYAALETLASGELGQAVSPVQCEVLYINHIPVEEGLDPRRDLAAILREFKPVSSSVLPARDMARFGERYILEHDDAPWGILLIECAPLVVSTGEPVLGIQLMVRGKPQETTHAGVLATFDRGHELIVKRFAEMTTRAMHDRWGRVQ